MPPSSSASPSEGGGGAGGGGDEESLEQLQQRIARLEAAGPAPAPGRPRQRLRTTGAVLLIVLASVLSLLAVLGVWARDEVTDTNRFVASVAPLASNTQVQDAVTNRVTTVVLQQIDVDSLVNQLSQAAAQNGVPPLAAGLINNLSGPINSGLTNLIGTVVGKVVSSPAFASAWTQAIRLAHSSMEKALTGEGGGAVQLQNNAVSIDLAPVIDQVKGQLVDSGFALAAKVPTVHTQLVVFESPDLAKVRSYFRLLEILGNWLPLITVLVAAGGVYLARDRRRALLGAAVGVVAAMLVLGIALAVFRSYYLDHLPSDVPPGAGGAVYDALTHYLRISVRSVGVLAAVVAVGAFFIGPSTAARTVRSAGSTGIGGVRTVAESVGFRAGPVERFVRRYKRAIGIAILLIASALFVLWDHPTGEVVLWFAVVVLVAFGIREFLAPSRTRLPSVGGPAD